MYCLNRASAEAENKVVVGESEVSLSKRAPPTEDIISFIVPTSFAQQGLGCSFFLFFFFKKAQSVEKL